MYREHLEKAGFKADLIGTKRKMPSTVGRVEAETPSSAKASIARNRYIGWWREVFSWSLSESDYCPQEPQDTWYRMERQTKGIGSPGQGRPVSRKYFGVNWLLLNIFLCLESGELDLGRCQGCSLGWDAERLWGWEGSENCLPSAICKPMPLLLSWPAPFGLPY